MEKQKRIPIAFRIHPEIAEGLKLRAQTLGMSQIEIVESTPAQGGHPWRPVKE